MKEEYEEYPQPERPTAGGPPRKRSGLILVLAVLAGVILAALAVFRLGGSWDRDPRPAPALTTPDPGDPTRTTAGSAPEAALRDGAISRADPSPAPNALAPLPEIDLPDETPRGELDAVALPALPFAIFNGAYRTPQEAETIREELLGHLVPSYIVPVSVQGTVAQSLYGVTADGFWYRIFIGHFPAQEDARRVLGILMDLRPNDQPEIMKFTYALECGRFLDDRSAEPLLNRLREDGFFPYVQTFPTRDGAHLSRVLVGCNFSRQGAEQQREALAERGYHCRIAER